MSQPVPNPGGLPSKPDYRANMVASAVAASNPAKPLPDALSTDFQKLGPALNQLQTPACVSHVVARLIQLWWFLKNGTILNFSPRFLHSLSGNPKYNGGVQMGPNDGRDPVSVMKIAMKYGCATVGTCENDTTLSPAAYMDPAGITAPALTEALNYKIPGYVLVPVSQYGIRQAISLYGAVGILFRISKAFWTDVNGNPTYAQAAIDPVRAPATPADVVSGHELIGNQWNDALDHFVNEWGITWAENGESDYLFNEWEPWITEAIAISEIPGDVLATVQGLPPPGEFKHTFSQTISYGMTNSEVRALQIGLSIAGFNTYPEVTGFYGVKTQQSVLAFQIANNVAPIAELQQLNGRSVGPATQSALNKLFN